MNCLRGYIGIMGCGADAAPESGLYVNHLPGISLEAIAKTTEAEQRTYLGAWNEIETRALIRFESALKSAFAKRYRIRSLKSSLSLGKAITEDDADISSSPFLVGYVHCTNPDYLERYGKACTNLQSTVFNMVPVYYADEIDPDNKPTLQLKIVDLDLKEIIYEESLEISSSGWNNMVLSQSFEGRKLFVGVVPDFTVRSMPITQKLSAAYLNMTSSFYGSECGEIKGAMLNDENDLSDITYGSDMFGVSGVISLVCGYENIVCNNKSVFKLALWNLLGVETVNDMLYSKRWNKFNFDRDQLKELRRDLGREFDFELETAVDGIDLNEDDVCLDCSSVYSHKSARP